MSIKIASMNFGDCDTILHNTPNGMKNIAEVLGPNGEVYWTATKELTGIPPLSIRSNGTMLLDYLISGNMSQSDTPTPQNPIMPQGTGERTENLIAGMFAGSIGATGGIAYSDQYVIYYVPVTAGETYTISGSYYVYAYYADKPTVGITSAVDNERHFTSQGNTITVISGASWIGIRATSRDIPMVNLGSTALPYENFGYKIPISSANTTTPVYLGEVQTTRKIKKLVLDGTESWNEGTSNYYIFIDVSGRGVGIPDSTALSTHTESGVVVNNNGTALFFKKSVFVHSSLADFRTYLQQQYAAGTPVTVWYVLATPTTGIVNEPLRKIGNYADTLSYEQAGVQIPTNRGNTVIDVLTELKPSQMYIKYK